MIKAFNSSSILPCTETADCSQRWLIHKQSQASKTFCLYSNREQAGMQNRPGNQRWPRPGLSSSHLPKVTQDAAHGEAPRKPTVSIQNVEFRVPPTQKTPWELAWVWPSFWPPLGTASCIWTANLVPIHHQPRFFLCWFPICNPNLSSSFLWLAFMWAYIH